MALSYHPPASVNHEPANVRYLFPADPPIDDTADETSTDEARAPAGGFAVIPAEVYALKDGYALAVYAALAKHADRATGVCWPAIATLMDLTGWTRPTIRKAVRLLADAGLVVIGERSRRGAVVSFEYRLTHHPTVKPPFTVEPERGNVLSPHDETSLHRTVKPGLPKLTSIELEPIEQENGGTRVPARAPKPNRSPKQAASDDLYARRLATYHAWCRGIGLDPASDDAEVGKRLALREVKGLEAGGLPSPDDIEGCARFMTAQAWRDNVPSLTAVVKEFPKWASKGRPERPEPKRPGADTMVRSSNGTVVVPTTPDDKAAIRERARQHIAELEAARSADDRSRRP